jgi:thioesterase domain-containing protein
VRTLFDAPTVAGLAQQVGSADNADEVIPVEVLNTGSGIPWCCIHDGFGLSWAYRALGKYVEGPIVGINQIPDGDEVAATSIRVMAANYADRLQARYPEGPYKLLGWSFGGVVAHALAVELRRRGCEIQQLVLLDPTVHANRAIALNPAWGQSHVLKHLLRANHIDIPRRWGRFSYQQAEELLRQQGAVEFALPPNQLLEFMAQSLNANWLLVVAHELDVFDGDVVIFSAARRRRFPKLRLKHPGVLARGALQYQHRSWRPYVSGSVTEHPVECTHDEMLSTAALNQYGKYLETILQA